MNGAQVLLRTLVAAGVDVCFMNPGTSEMHSVAALDAVPGIRGVLALFEGVATGAADGYGRIAERPAATLLHLGPGLGNGLANLHNARRARTPIVNVVGDHATYHKQHDAPLESDIESLARNVSQAVRRLDDPAGVAHAARCAVADALGPPAGVSTLILPADLAWGETGGAEGADLPPEPAAPGPAPGPGHASAPAAHGPAPAPRPGLGRPVPAERVEAVAAALRSGEPCGILVGGSACRAAALVDASRIATTTSAKLLCETFPARLERGAGIPAVERIAYLGEIAALQLGELKHLVLAGARSPVAFFAYPGKPSVLVPKGCEVHELASPDAGDDAAGALAALAEAVGAPPGAAVRAPASRPQPPEGGLTSESLMVAIGALLPENAIVSDEGNTSSIFAGGPTAGAPPHDWLTLTGGAIGQGLPLAAGAAVASPGRRVVAIEADGSALYTFQALWTMAREGLDVTTVICNNRSYSILNMELNRVGAEPPGPLAKAMLDLEPPGIDFVAIARGLGVPATRATTAAEAVDQLGRAFATPGPTLVEAIVPPAL